MGYRTSCPSHDSVNGEKRNFGGRPEASFRSASPTFASFVVSPKLPRFFILFHTHELSKLSLPWKGPALTCSSFYTHREHSSRTPRKCGPCRRGPFSGLPSGGHGVIQSQYADYGRDNSSIASNPWNWRVENPAPCPEHRKRPRFRAHR